MNYIIVCNTFLLFLKIILKQEILKKKMFFLGRITRHKFFFAFV